MNKKVFGSLVALSLLVSGVGTAAASAPAARSTATQGVTDDAIKIGITYVDLASLRARNIVDTDHGDYEVAFNAIIDDLNENGGIDGRTLDPVFATVNPIGTTPAQEACVKLTEDEQVFAAVGFFLGDAPLCYLEAHKIPIIGGNLTEEYTDRAQAPWFSTEPGDAATGQVIDALAKEGAFKRKPVAIIAASTQELQVKNFVVPALKRNGIKPKVFLGDAPPGDIPAAEAETDILMQRFESDGVKTIVGVNGSENGVADSLVRLGSDYRPRLVATVPGGLTAFAQANVDDPYPAIFKHALSAGPQPIFDEPQLQHCFRLVEKAAGLDFEIKEEAAEGEPDWRVSATTACQTIALFKAIVEAAGPNLTVKSFGKAGDNLLKLDLPGLGATTYDPATRSYAQPIFIYRYDVNSDQKLVADSEPVKGV